MKTDVIANSDRITPTEREKEMSRTANPVEAYLSAQPSSNSSNRAHPGDALVDLEKYVDLKGVAQLLQRSALRTRKIVNSGGIASIRKEGKIFCLREDVLTYKSEKLGKRVQNVQARIERGKKRIIRSAATIRELVLYDSKLSDDEKRAFISKLDEYAKSAKSSLAKKS